MRLSLNAPSASKVSNERQHLCTLSEMFVLHDGAAERKRALEKENTRKRGLFCQPLPHRKTLWAAPSFPPETLPQHTVPALYPVHLTLPRTLAAVRISSCSLTPQPIPSLPLRISKSPPANRSRTAAATLAGIGAGILGLTGLSGFYFFAIVSALLSVRLSPPPRPQPRACALRCPATHPADPARASSAGRVLPARGQPAGGVVSLAALHCVGRCDGRPLALCSLLDHRLWSGACLLAAGPTREAGYELEIIF